ncbi:MAG: hypothetical protein LBV27_05250 [Oscillospiraceae bacterium]|nr:hypothetical protein [Oscillospiraceae bacterium]
MSFISELMVKIWEPESLKYKKLREEYDNLSDGDFTARVSAYFDGKDADESVYMTALNSCGCPYWNQNGILSGCSFCDFFSKHFEGFVLLGALKDRNRERYEALIIDRFYISRAKEPNINMLEHITGFDSLNTDEISAKLHEELLGEESSFFKDGFTVLSCETRATSVTPQRVRSWKKNVKGRLRVECGAEVHNEWLRNHWINKGITDCDLSRAARILREERCLFACDVIIGIPGLSERQSIALFPHAFRFCVDLGAMQVITSPLLRKGVNLQSAISEKLGQDSELTDIGIGGNGPIGIHVFSVLLAVCSAVKKYPEDASKLKFAGGHFDMYCRHVKELYTDGEEARVVNIALEGLCAFSRTGKTDQLDIAYEQINSSRCFADFCDRLHSQHGLDQIQETMRIVAEKMAKVYWPADWKEKLHEFGEELKGFSL